MHDNQEVTQMQRCNESEVFPATTACVVSLDFIAALMLSSFYTMYLCEVMFSASIIIKLKYQSTLKSTEDAVSQRIKYLSKTELFI